MAITTTTNKSLIKVTVGTEAGTWGPYINTDQDLLDNMLGGTATIALTNAPVTLSSAQYQCAFLRFTGAITADVAITFPSVGSFYTIINDTTNSSNFNLTAKTTAAGGRIIGVPPGNMTDMLTDGVNARFRGLLPVGAYWDYAGSSVPRWVSACTVPPWIYCDGSAFSSATYPALNSLLNSVNVPDLRGRIRGSYNDGTGRITAAGGVDGNSLFASGGINTVTIGQTHIPSYSLTVNDPSHSHGLSYATGTHAGGGFLDVTQIAASGLGVNINTATHATGITVDSAGSGTALATLPPMIIGGITMIRGG